jgi:pyruvate/2-oxoglutarate dehydrogenase complex dihydrolipoamide acyltransferase (E2) component
VAQPSGEQPGYAERYPGRLTATRARFADEETKARSDFGEFKGFPEALRNTDFSAVDTVIVKADAAGKSSSYTEAQLEAESVKRFFAEEKDGLRQKVGGAVAYGAKEKQCTEDLGGIAVGAMERGVEKQLEERVRSYSDAQRYIEDHPEELGKQNLATLEKQADKISHASYVVHVRLELYRREVEALLGDASTVSSTLDRTLRENEAVATDAAASKAKKAAATRRHAAAKAAKDQLDAEVDQAKRAVEEMKTRISAIQSEYRTALDALREDLKKRAENLPKT